MRSTANQELTLFQKKVESKTSKTLPVLSEEEKAKLFSGETIQHCVSYFYSPERAKRHHNAQMVMHALYHLGAVLINTGAAYNPNSNLLLTNGSLLTNRLPEDPSQPISTTENTQTSLLMQIYNNVPTYLAKNGSHYADNPLHAVFVIRVALDHIPAQSIYHCYQQLKEQARSMTLSTSQVKLPNGSQFLNDHAVYQLLGHYIINHPDKFCISSSEREKLVYNCYKQFNFILGEEVSAIKLQCLKQILMQDPPTFTNENQKAVENKQSQQLVVRQEGSTHQQCRLV